MKALGPARTTEVKCSECGPLTEGLVTMTEALRVAEAHAASDQCGQRTITHGWTA